MIGPAVLCLAATAVLVAAERQHLTALRAVAKMTASVAFIAHAVAGGAMTAGPVGAAFLAALLLSLVGDLCLLSRERLPFLAGLAAFLVAHVAFTGAFGLLGVSVIATAVATVPLSIAGWVVWIRLRPHVGKLGRPVAAYIIVICAMVAFAVGAAAASPTPARMGLVVGAVLFFLSDLCVARDRFLAPGWDNRAVGLPLYYAAQLVLGGLAGLAAGGG